MNLKIDVEDKLGRQLNQLAEQQEKKLNVVICEALENWVKQQAITSWPNQVMNYEGDSSMLAFESYRKELIPADELEL